MQNRPLTYAILTGGLTAGGLDISYAMLSGWLKSDLPARVILQSVASGIHGRAAYSGGWPVAMQGLGLHFFMTMMMAIAFCLAASRYRILLDRIWPSIIVYGLMLLGLMRYIVVPLSNAAIGKMNPTFWGIVGLLFAHIVMVAVPVVLSARYFMKDLSLPDRDVAA